VQFREIEIKLGLNTHDRQSVDREFFVGRLSERDRNHLIGLENQTSLLRLVEAWLERLPYTQTQNFNFWNKYQETIEKNLNDDEATIKNNSAHLTEKAIAMQLENLAMTRSTFNSLFDEASHQTLIQNQQRKLSQKAILNALFIMLYREEPMLSLPFQVLTSMMDIDENFTAWRYRHALMAQRMLGTKIGTGGSSGHQYLKRATENNRVFIDLFNLSSFLIPRSQLPQVPEDIKQRLHFSKP
jgi:tryptophan 2,3-dioxygenase